MRMQTPHAHAISRRTKVGRFCLALLAAVGCAFVSPGQEAKAAEAPAQSAPSMLPAAKTVRQQATINGKSISYDVTIGALPVYDDKHAVAGEVVYTSYVKTSGDADRPVTFAFNGGPGAASVYLNFGAMGPKRLQFGAAGDAASDPVDLKDNPYSWLPFTDLVFIDPVDTGFSRSYAEPATAKKLFFGMEQDIDYLARIIYDWLLENKRMRSPKYIAGESYGGYRGPRLTRALQTDLGVGVKGVVLVSPLLDLRAIRSRSSLSPLPWMMNLPSMAAANLENAGKLTPQAMAEIEDYTRTQFVLDFFEGQRNPAALARLVNKVAELTGLDHDLVEQLDGRVDKETFLRELHRDQKRLSAGMDSNVTAYDPFPASAARQGGDPLSDSLHATTTSAMVDFLTRVLDWPVSGEYKASNGAVFAGWDWGDVNDAPVIDLRKAVASDPNLNVLIVHGYNDLSCPYFTSRLVIDHMPAYGDKKRVKLAVYPGGHMFYSRPGSSEAFLEDVEALYKK